MYDDNYFVSVTAAGLLHMNRLKFIGVIKIEIKKYPMAHLAAYGFENRDDNYGWWVKKNVMYYLLYGWIRIDAILLHPLHLYPQKKIYNALGYVR